MDPILVDTYAGDFSGKPPIAKMLAWSACVGLILKVSEGTYYKGQKWLAPQWRDARQLAGDRYGKDWFRGGYHYLKFDTLGDLQADYFLQAIDEAGGWGPGDLPPVIDCELGGARDSNQRATAQQIVDCVSACAERLKGALGRPVILYGIGAMRERGITSRMGCDYLWPARYTATLPRTSYEEIGWDVTSLFAWQYSGTETGGKLPGYPYKIPGTTDYADLSAVQVKDLRALCDARAGGAAAPIEIPMEALYDEDEPTPVEIPIARVVRMPTDLGKDPDKKGGDS